MSCFPGWQNGILKIFSITSYMYSVQRKKCCPYENWKNLMFQMKIQSFLNSQLSECLLFNNIVIFIPLQFFSCWGKNKNKNKNKQTNKKTEKNTTTLQASILGAADGLQDLKWIMWHLRLKWSSSCQGQLHLKSRVCVKKVE